MSVTNQHIILESPANDFREALEQLLKSLVTDSDTLDASQLLRSVLQREELGSTVLGAAIAVPHVRIENLGTLRTGYIRLVQSVDNLQGERVRAMFVVLVDVNRPTDHLAVLAKVAGLIQEPVSCEILLTGTADEIARLFQD